MSAEHDPGHHEHVSPAEQLLSSRPAPQHPVALDNPLLSRAIDGRGFHAAAAVVHGAIAVA